MRAMVMDRTGGPEVLHLPQMVAFDRLEVGEAHRILQRGHTRGKLVLRVAEL
ncbi:MAG: hypothetical protein KDI09_09855 [Halioglobus sp.]|nr:hypothetical protein [Halioglobus sp.]